MPQNILVVDDEAAIADLVEVYLTNEGFAVHKLGAGYGLDFRAERETNLAVLTIGYADGLPRSLAQNGGQVLLHGQLCPMVGRMCMDQLFVDVMDAPVVSHGDIATLIGRDGPLEIRVEELAWKCGTIPNELLSRLGGRLGVVQLLQSDSW